MAIKDIKPIKYVTGEVYLIYPHFKQKQIYINEQWCICDKLIEKGLITQEDAENKGSFGTSFILEPEKNKKDIENINKIIFNLVDLSKFKKGWHNPLKSGNEINEDRKNNDKHELEYLKDVFTFKTSSKFDVRLVDGQKNPFNLLNDNDINGWVARLIILFKPYKTGTSYGITTYLNAVQMIKPGITIGSSLDEFDCYEEEEKKNDEVDEDELPF